jgi:hypothetical protein
MVARSADCIRGAVGIPDDTSEIGVEPLTEIRWEPFLSVFGGEDDVKDKDKGGMR